MTGRTVQSLPTWDGLPAVLAAYDWAGTADLRPRVNDGVAVLLGSPAGLTGLFPDTAGLAGPQL